MEYLWRLKFRTGNYLARARQVLVHDKTYAALTDANLREAARGFLAMFRTGRDKPADPCCGRWRASAKWLARQSRGEKHYMVQVAGALSMLDGCIAEMATGEGKTLTATLVATVAGWRGRGCHVITVNDYLAKRDAEAMRGIYEFCGLTVASIDGDAEPPERRAGYHCDITYLTNKEVCADFLRDRLSLGRLRDLPSALLAKMLNGQGTDRLVMRGMAFGIIDEADSILIDEAVTPLIISGDARRTSEQVEASSAGGGSGVARLVQQKHYKVNHRYREIELTRMRGFGVRHG